MDTVSTTLYAFGHGQLDLGRRELQVDGRLVELQPLVFDLLAYLLKNPGRAIGKDELLQQVWGDGIGSDAVIARAVLKARRAIGDDGQEPRFLKTVHRIGYRLDLAVEATVPADVLPQAQVPDRYFEVAVRCPALLPCANHSGDASLDWVEQGLPSLVQQLAGGPTALALVPMEWAQAHLDDEDAGADLLARTCEATGAPEAVRTVLQSGAIGRLRLQVWRGRNRDDAATHRIEGLHVADLARRLVDLLSAQAPDARPTEGEAFWEEQLGRALDLAGRGVMDQALQLMDECTARLPPTPQILLAHAGMLRRSGRRDAAGERARAALALMDDSDELRAQAWFEMGAQAWHNREIDASIRLFEQALQAAQSNDAAAAVIPEILAFYSNVERERGAVVESIRLAERAIAASLSLGDQTQEVHARVCLGSALLQAGMVHRAGEVLRRAAELARRHGLALKEAFALRILALLDQQEGRYALAVDEARRAAALAARAGHADMRDSALTQELVSLVYLGRLDEAEAAAARLRAAPTPAWENTVSLRYGAALLAWRRGEGAAAAALMRTLADEAVAAGWRLVPTLRLEQCFQQISLGDLAGAAQARADLDTAASRIAYLHAGAALALARGDRDGARAQLREATQRDAGGSAEALPVEADLAWMLLEDGETDELGALIGHLAEAHTEQPAGRVAMAAWFRLHNPAVLADGEWSAVLRDAPRLVERHPWVATPDLAGVLRTPGGPRLSELLSRAVW